MARISTHVLDITRGTPAQGIAVELHLVKGAERRLIAAVTTNSDGRTDQPLISGDQLETGIYELSFHAADYFHRLGVDADRSAVHGRHRHSHRRRQLRRQLPRSAARLALRVQHRIMSRRRCNMPATEGREYRSWGWGPTT